jgi:hypothetical protein
MSVVDGRAFFRNGTGAVVRGFGRTADGEVEQESALVTADFTGLKTVPATRNAAGVVLDAMRVELHTGHGHS